MSSVARIYSPAILVLVLLQYPSVNARWCHRADLPMTNLSKISESCHTIDLRPEEVTDQLGVDAVHQLTEGLLKSSFSGKLKLSENNLAQLGPFDWAIQHLALAIRKHSEVYGLYLDYNGISHSGAAILGQVLRENKHLEILVLNSNYVHDRGLAELGAGLEKNGALHTLDLAFNTITALGFDVFCKSVSENKALRVLNLAHNNLWSKGGFLIAGLLSRNMIIHELSVSFNEIPDDALGEIARSLAQNKGLRDLDAHGNMASDKSAVAFATALKENLVLERLDLSNNRIGEAGIEALIIAAEGRPVPLVLLLEGNSGFKRGYALRLEKNNARYGGKIREEKEEL